jgi:hypothetical protein
LGVQEELTIKLSVSPHYWSVHWPVSPRLFLEYTNKYDDAWNELSFALASDKILKKISFETCHLVWLAVPFIYGAALPAVVEALKSNTTLEILNIHCALIDIKLAQALGGFLAFNASFKRLVLHHCVIGRDAIAVTRAFAGAWGRCNNCGTPCKKALHGSLEVHFISSDSDCKDDKDFADRVRNEAKVIHEQICSLRAMRREKLVAFGLGLSSRGTTLSGVTNNTNSAEEKSFSVSDISPDIFKLIGDAYEI